MNKVVAWRYVYGVDVEPNAWVSGEPEILDYNDLFDGESIELAYAIPDTHCVVQGWQSIDTAPRDGTAILACYGPQYESNGFLPVAVRFRNFHPNAKGKEEFRDHTGAKCVYLTHWMPLPPPPAMLNAAEVGDE